MENISFNVGVDVAYKTFKVLINLHLKLESDGSGSPTVGRRRNESGNSAKRYNI
jgi:hypothetical protein